jgi:hypothetical protein
MSILCATWSPTWVTGSRQRRARRATVTMGRLPACSVTRPSPLQKGAACTTGGGSLRSVLPLLNPCPKWDMADSCFREAAAVRPAPEPSSPNQGDTMAPHYSHSMASIAFFARFFAALLPYKLAQMETITLCTLRSPEKHAPARRTKAERIMSLTPIFCGHQAS